jgi:hypothetical protein
VSEKKRIYIAGPMSGYPLFNFPAFDEAAAYIDKHFPGCVPVNPAQIDRDYGFDPATLPEDYDWNVIPESVGTREEIIRRDINALLTCHSIYMLPGWENSSGAKAELQLARWAGLNILQDPMAKNPLLHDFLDPPQVPALISAPGTTEHKDTNPKDSVGCTKPPLHCIPAHVLFEVGMGMFEGGWKYREANYRVIGVRASIYYDAAMRHLMAWWEGEDIDPASKIHHISKVMSCLAVLRDCQMQAENGSGVSYKDDRPPKSHVPMSKLEEQFKVMAARLQSEHGDRKPPYTEAKA